MATVETLNIDVKASVDKAVRSFTRVKGSLSSVSGESKTTTKSVKDTALAFEATAEGVAKATRKLKEAGFKETAKEFQATQKHIQAMNMKEWSAAVSKMADDFDAMGNKSAANFFRQRSNPLAHEQELVRISKEQAAVEDLQKEAAQAFADGEKLIQKISDANTAKKLAGQKVSANIEKEIAAKSASVRTQIVNAAQKRERDAIKETARVAKECADSDRAYRELTNNAIIKSVKDREAEVAKATKQKEKEDRIGSAALAKARANAAAQKQAAASAAASAAAKQKAKDDKDAEDAAKRRAKEEKKLSEELQKQADAKWGNEEKRNADSLKGLKKAFKGISDILPKFEKRLFGVFRMFGRIAMYRAVRAAIKALTAALKEGLTNLKAYSKEVGTAFAPAVDNLRSHVLWLKNAIATALRPVIEALIPIIQRLVDWLVKASDFLAQVFSLMTGRVDENGRYTKAILTDLQESNEEAKRLLRTLLGFDEINRLDGENGKDNAQNAGLMFTQADPSEKAVEWAARLTEWLEKIKQVVGDIDWETVLKVLAALKAVQILRKVFGWVKSIAAVLSGTGGLVALAVAVGGAFALWGDKIKEFIDSTAIKKVEDFFEKLKKPFGKGSLGETWISNGQLDLTYLLKYVGNIGKVIHSLFHGDVDGALDASKESFRDYFNYLKQKFDLFAGWIWDNIFAPVANWAARITYNIYRDINNAIIDVEIALNEGMLWVLRKWNAVLGEIEKSLNNGIAAFNLITGRDVKPINLHVEMKEYYDAIDTLESKRLPPLKENVKMYGTWEQQKAKFNLDTSDAERRVNSISQKISDIAKKLLEAITKGSNAIGSGGSRNASPFTPNQYASGGFPTMGTMFIAGERGAEYVGDIGGRTGVMNTEQMAAAMYTAMSQALANNPQGGDIYLDGEVIYRNTVRRNNNQVRATGRTALLT